MTLQRNDLHALRPMLWVTDVKATINYYMNTLGFDREHYVADLEWGYVQKDKVEIMFATLSRLSKAATQPTMTGSIYFNTYNVEGWWVALKDKADIFYPIETFPYGMREFGIRDCNGYILQFGQEA